MRVAAFGRAKASLTRPMAAGECDRCGEWVNHAALIPQKQWAGNSLIDTGYLVCNTCVDVPQDQFRKPVLPPDPRPVINPWISFNITPIPAVGQPLPTSPENLGFTQYTIDTNAGAGMWPMSQSLVLSTVLSLAGVTAPGGVTAYAQAMPRNVSQQLFVANAVRRFLLVYNPTANAVQLALSTAVTTGTNTNFALGPGQAYFWSNSQGLGNVWTGPMAAIAPFGASLPVWFWTDDGSNGGFQNDGGVLLFNTPADASAYPTSFVGLSAGAVWYNAGPVGIVSGGSGAGSPVYYPITTDALLALGGGGLPTVPGPVGSLQLWNNGGEVAIS